MSGGARYPLFFLLGGMLLAIHVAHVTTPVQQPLAPVTMPDGWMSTSQPAHRGYFRHTLEVPFRPRHAWIGIAAEDYRLYVNGVDVAHNTYLLRAGTAFQDRLSAEGQSLTQWNVFPRGGGASVAKAAKREWRMVHFYDLRPHLKQGRNTLAVYVQSERLNRLAILGGAAGEGAELDIPGRPSAWRVRTEGTSEGGLPWFHPLADDLTWDAARAERAPEDLALYAAAHPDIWKEPLQASTITSPAQGDEHIFRSALPAEGSAPKRGGWLRVSSGWPYDLFVRDQWVGRGGGTGQVEAFDVSAFLSRAPGQIAVRMHRDPAAGAVAAEGVPWLAVDGRIGSIPVSGASGWTYLSAYHPDWLQGGGEWIAAAAHERTDAPGPIRYQISQGRTWTWLLSWLGAALGLSLALAVAAWGLSNVGRHGTEGAGVPSLAWGCWLLAPALLGILVYEALRFRFAESDTLLAFLNPETGWLLLATGPVLLLASLVWLTRPGPQAARPRVPTLSELAERVPALFWLALICILGLGLRVHALEFQPPSGDDYTSWEAARGILRRGVPEAASGVLYTRSPLFHYLLAGWMGLFGDSLASVRMFALLPGVGLIPAIYVLVAAITRRRPPALLAALVLALDPWLLANTNLIRFYQLMQFFAVLAVLFFLKGFIWREGKRHQNLFFLLATAGVLSQEIFATTFAAFLLAFLICYRPFCWREDSNVWIGFAATMLVCWLDLRTFGIVSLTPHVAISSWSESLFVPHLVDLFGGTTSVVSQLATDFFWMNNGENAFWSMLFFTGLFYWARRGDRAMLALYALVLLTVLIVTVLVVPINSRYAYGVYPVLVAAAIISADAMIRRVAQGGFGTAAVLAPATRRRLAALATGILIAGWVASSEFDKLGRSYSTHRELDYRRAWEHIAAHKQPGDKLVAVRTPGAGVVFGGIDYYAMVRPGFDGLYQRPHGIVDRWSGGKLLWKVDQFRDVLLHHERVWVVVDEPRYPRMNPGVAAFLEACCSVESEFFGGQVLLWDRSAGRFATAADQGGGADSF